MSEDVVRCSETVGGSAPRQMSELNGLLACPFCGLEGTVFITSEDSEQFQVKCVNDGDFKNIGCGASGGIRKTEREAVEVWNERYVEAADKINELKQQCEKLENIIEAIQSSECPQCFRIKGMGASECTYCSWDERRI